MKQLRRPLLSQEAPFLWMVAFFTVAILLRLGFCACTINNAQASTVLKPAVSAARPTTGEALDAWERQCFGLTYPTDGLALRVDRLERYVLGQATPALPMPQRLTRLEKIFLPAAATLNLPPAASHPEKQAPKSSGHAPGSALPPLASEKNSDATDYPVVTEMEKKALGQTYPQQDLTLRLNRLEGKVYGSPRPGLPLFDRVDGLSTKILGNNPELAGGEENPTVISRTGSYDTDPQAAPLTETEMANATGQMEKAVLKQSYPNDPLNVRLGRLETRIFHKAEPDTKSNQERFQRIVAVASGGGTRPPGLMSNAWVRQVLPVVIMLMPLLL